MLGWTERENQLKNLHRVTEATQWKRFKREQIYKTKIISKKKEETNNSRKREDMD